MCSEGSDPNVGHRGLQAAVVLLAAFVMGLCAGVLSWLGGMSVAGAVLAGFAASGAVALFILTVLRFIRSGV
jgi:hypothetical protein